MVVSPLHPARAAWLVVAGLTALALLLPTANPTLDAWYYAACVRWRYDLLLPHHLLYNPLGVAWVRLWPPDTDVLAVLTAGNALIYGGILLALRPLLRAAGAAEASIAAWLLVVGSTFGLLRFATENEVYLAPLLLSVLASGAWARWALGEAAGTIVSNSNSTRPSAQNAGWLLLAGALAAGACLLLQLHVWWWLALALGTWWGGGRGRPLRWRAAVLYVLPALLVPGAYALAAVREGFGLTPSGLTRFILHDYVVNGATPTPGLKALLLTGINLIRTLGQVHGSTGALLLRWPALALVPVGVGALLWRARRAWQGQRPAVPNDALASVPAVPAVPAAGQQRFRYAHALAFGLHLAFAAINDGNAEFMAMLPVLGAVLVAGRGRWAPGPLALAGAALLIWNLTFGLLPSHLLTLNASAALAARVQATPGAWWLLTDQHLTENRLTYQTGRFQWPRLRAAPTPLVRRANGDARPFRRWLAAELAAGRIVYTDALSPPALFDRARLIHSNHDRELLQGVAVTARDTVATAFGAVVIVRLGRAPEPKSLPKSLPKRMPKSLFSHPANLTR